jgi:branched-chain amino acid transport system ATP-binding protein
VLQINNLMVFFENALALNDFTMTVKENELVGVIGSNSAGKTTLMNAVSGLIVDMRIKEQRKGGVRITLYGEIVFRGEDITNIQPYERVKRGLVLSRERHPIFPESDVLENLKIAGHRARKPELREMMSYVFGLFPALGHLKRRKAGFLSGGEQQMLAIGRALMARPKLMLLDEPSLGLAPLLVKEIFEIVHKICSEEKTTILLVEQNANLALSIGHYGYVMEMGKVVLDGECEKLRENEDVREFYLGLSDVGKKKSFKDAKHYKRRKRWLS